MLILLKHVQILDETALLSAPNTFVLARCAAVSQQDACGARPDPEPEATSSYIEQREQSPASLSPKDEKHEEARPPQKPAQAHAASGKKKAQTDKRQVVYIDHYPEPFVKSYFGDDGSEEIPDDWRGQFFHEAVSFVASKSALRSQ